MATSGSTSSPYLFAATSGYRNDNDDGLMLVGARYYDPAVGLFITRDTDLSKPPYQYCNDDPVNKLDPSGHVSWGTLGAIIGGFVVGGAVAIITDGAATSLGVQLGMALGAGIGNALGEHYGDGQGWESAIGDGVVTATGTFILGYYSPWPLSPISAAQKQQIIGYIEMMARAAMMSKYFPN